MPYFLLVIIFSLLLLPGLLGVFLPLLPSIPYMFVVTLIFGLIDKFQHLTVVNLIILGIIALFSLLVDYFSGALGAKYGGASKKTLFWGIIGLILGLIVFPPFGGIAGLFLGVLVAELIQYKDHLKALKAASGSLIGSLTGMILNFLLALFFFVLFLVFAVK